MPVRRLFRWSSLVLSLGVLIRTAACTSDPPPIPPPPAPRLIVLVVIDQLRGDELRAHRSLFRYGMHRLLNEGRWYTRAMHGHFRTETAAGHATISTGMYPRDHGVVDKIIFDDARGKALKVCRFGSGPRCDASALRVPTLGDRLKASRPASKVVALGQKARAAALLGGKSADLVMWTGPWGKKSKTGAVVTTRAGAPDAGWAERFYEQVASPDRISRIWELPRLPESYAATSDAGSSEADCGHGTTFPHEIARTVVGDALYWAWFATPDSDRALVEVVHKTVQRMKLGDDDVPDLLLVSFGGFDAIGHNFGPDSLERAAAFTELDRQLGDLLDSLKDQVGPSVLVALTSDHGVAPVVDVACTDGHDSKRVEEPELLEPVRAALNKALGPGDHLGPLSFPFLKLNVPANKRAAAIRVAKKALEAHPDVHIAYVVADLDEDGDELEQLVYQNAAPGRSGDLAIVLEPYRAYFNKYRGHKGAEHGSAWQYDRHVPIILWGDHVTPAEIKTEVSVIDLTRTLADRLSLPSDERHGKPLE